jgi:hypothetical protein
MDSGLTIHRIFFINCCRACYNRNSRVSAASHGGPEESGERLKHSEARGYISNNCKAKQVRDDEAMTESWRDRDKGPISAATVSHAGQWTALYTMRR